MTKKHLKRYFAPKTWNIKRKANAFITRPNPGGHLMNASLPLNIVIRDLLNYSTTTRETKRILQKKNVFVDGKRRKELKFPVGLFDTIHFKETGKSFRVVLDEKGFLTLASIENGESALKPCKILNKTIVKGKVQLNLNDGKNLIVDKDVYKTHDTLLISVPDMAIKSHLSLKKNSLVYLIGGKHIGETGKVIDVVGRRVMYLRKNGQTTGSLMSHVFVIGDNKPIITI